MSRSAALRAEAREALAAAGKCFADAREAEQDAFAWWTARRSTAAAIDDMAGNVALRRAWFALADAARSDGWGWGFIDDYKAARREAIAVDRAERANRRAA